MKRRRLILFLILAAILLAGVVYVRRGDIIRRFFKPTPTDSGRGTDGGEPEVTAEGLEVPWEIVFLPDGDILLTERSGRLRRLGREPAVFRVDGVRQAGEGGLLGLALHPNFIVNRLLYIYYTAVSDGNLQNRVERYRLDGEGLSGRRVILAGIPGARIHNGGRIAFGPEGYLYITTGDAGNGRLAQDRQSLAGKILRLSDDGSIPAGNPFNNAVYSYGHRNPQGLAWDDRGRLWSTEHGPRGFDEINLIEAGGNYGWPRVTGDGSGSGLTPPVIHSGRDETWAPAGMTVLDGHILFGGLRGEALFDLNMDNRRLRHHFRGRFGRIRAVAAREDGFIYISTSNRDGRGQVRQGDDRLIRIGKDVLR